MYSVYLFIYLLTCYTIFWHYNDALDIMVAYKSMKGSPLQKYCGSTTLMTYCQCVDK